MSQLLITLTVFILMFSSCSSTSRERAIDSPLETLNGQNYRTPVSGGNGDVSAPIPLIEEGNSTTISGNAVVENDLGIPDPLKFQMIILMEGKKMIARDRTDAQGAFRFTGAIPNGVYHFQVESGKYEIKQVFRVSHYIEKDLQLFAKSVAQPSK